MFPKRFIERFRSERLSERTQMERMEFIKFKIIREAQLDDNKVLFIS